MRIHFVGDGASDLRIERVTNFSPRVRIQALMTDLPRVWHDPRTPMRERKRMLLSRLETSST